VLKTSRRTSGFEPRALKMTGDRGLVVDVENIVKYYSRVGRLRL
jgi:hypothetical protein